MIDKNNFLNLINERTCNKFNFLKLKQVFFDVNKNELEIHLIYPEFITLLDSDKLELIDAIKTIIDYKGIKINIKINKSFVESDLIKRCIIDYLQKNNPLFFGKGEEDLINIEISKSEDNNKFVKISLNAEEDLCSYAINTKLKEKLLNYLNSCFCASFDINFNPKQNKNESEYFLKDRLSAIEYQSDLATMVKSMENKYIVKDKQALVGEIIEFHPRFINSIGKDKIEVCVIAGKINYLTEKTYKSKRTKKNKDGEEERIEKPYFTFSVKDDTGVINAIVFPNKKNYHKMHLLKDGDTVLIQGKLDKFNDKFEVVTSKINLCSFYDNSTKINTVSQTNSYVNIKPVKYTSTKQSNLFDNQANLSNEILSHNFVVYDFETTGIDPNKDQIIEIGALKIENGVFTQVFTTLIKPTIPIPLEASRINRITNDMVANCLKIEQVIGDFYLFCKGCQMVGYNSIAFDNQFLQKAAKNVGLNFDNGQIDVFLLAKEKLKGLKNYKLGTVSKYLDVNLLDAHRALNDVIATAEVFLKLY